VTVLSTKENLDFLGSNPLRKAGVGHPILEIKDENNFFIKSLYVTLPVFPFALLNFCEIDVSLVLPFAYNEVSTK